MVIALYISFISSLICLLTFQKQPSEVFYKNDVLQNFAKFIGNHMYQSPFFSKIADLRCTALLKTRLWHRCFPVNFTKFLRRTFLKNIFGRLLLTFDHYLSHTLGKLLRTSFVTGFLAEDPQSSHSLRYIF